MAPHAISPQSQIQSEDAAFFQSFNVTENGFLPSEAPLKCLPDAYYDPWEQIIQRLESLIKSGELHDEVLRLPVLSTEYLSTDAEWRRAYVILTFLTHSYVWGGETPQEILPPAITVPLLQVSDYLEVPPVATYAGLNLWNFSSSTSDFTDLDNLQSLHTFTGTRDEAWFYLVSVAMEAQGGHVMSTMLKALHSIKSRDYDIISSSLIQLSDNIQKTGVLLERMYEHNDPMTFFHDIRPFLAGSKNMAAAGLPNGVFYDEGDGKGQWRQLRGGSNGQSSLIQFLDIVLGVEHTSHGNTKSPHAVQGEKTKAPAFHEEVREYMPGPHRRFLQYVTQMGSIRELAMHEPRTPEQERLRTSYQTAIQSLTEFRNKHLQIVTRYIVLPSKKGPRGPATKVDLASASEAKSETQELTGTGGTALIPFLKQTRDETSDAGDLSQKP